MPLYPGTDPVTVVQCNDIPTHAYEELRVSFNTHAGTHIDAPSHMKIGAPSLSSIPIANFQGKAYKVDLRHLTTDVITIDDLLPHQEAISKCEWVIVQTGWSQHWGSMHYFGPFPCLNEEAAKWLVQFPLKGIALDCISVDPCSSENYPIHHILFEKNMLIVENLKDLDQLDVDEFQFSCFPLNIRNADGSPIRGIAYVN
ncbi:hypothetical protein RCL1_002658 [Eukaryota sp. TZLM3-RCL]